jgi:protein-tyrosine phosphatase
MKPVNVLMVCMGNICRSPTAHGVFAKKLFEQGLSLRVQVDSAGTYAGHKGEPPDRRARQVAAKRGYDLDPLRSRPLRTQDFEIADYIVVMDEHNRMDVQKRAQEAQYRGVVAKLLDFSPNPAQRGMDVPDPYYGGNRGFEIVLDLVEPACDGLIEHLVAQGLKPKV